MNSGLQKMSCPNPKTRNKPAKGRIDGDGSFRGAAPFFLHTILTESGHFPD